MTVPDRYPLMNSINIYFHLSNVAVDELIISYYYNGRSNELHYMLKL